MDPVSNVDQIVHVLRQRLQERSKAGRGERRGSATGAIQARPGGLERLRSIAAVENLDERQLRRALVQSLLVERFGGDVLNDAKFQQVIDEVLAALESDQATSRLVGQVTSALRAVAG